MALLQGDVISNLIKIIKIFLVFNFELTNKEKKMWQIKKIFKIIKIKSELNYFTLRKKNKNVNESVKF